MRDLRWFRQYVTDEASIMKANPLVGSCLDYCNSLFRSLPSLDMLKLQCIRNTLARIVNTDRHLIFLNPSCCIFKIATLVCKLLHSGHPSYFGSLYLLLVEDIVQVKIVSLQKGIPNLAHTLSGVSAVLDLAIASEAFVPRLS